VRVQTNQRASRAYDAQIPAIKPIHQMQNCHGHTRGIAETLQITAAPKRKAPHSSRAGERSGRVRIVSITLSIFFLFVFTASTEIFGLPFSSELRGGG
jgi:hypothetical protein